MTTPDRPSGRRPSLGARLFLAVLMPVLFFAAAEGILRLAGFGSGNGADYGQFHVPEIRSDGYDTDPVVFWKLKPDFQGPVTKNHPWPVAINGQRMRSPDTTVAKKPGTFRIVSIGDSSTFGWGVPETNCYSRVVERLLNEGGAQPPVEVVNAGTPGYTSYQGLRYLERDLLAYEPDLVLAYFGLNDLTGARFFADKDQRVGGAKAGGLRAALGRLRVYQVIESLLRRKPEAQSFDSYFAATDHFRVAPDDYAANLQSMKQLGEARGFRVFFITPIWNNQKDALFDYPFWFPEPEKVFPAIAPVVDTYARLKPMESRVRELYMDPAHPTEEGHRIIAETIRDALIREQAVPGR